MSQAMPSAGSSSAHAARRAASSRPAAYRSGRAHGRPARDAQMQAHGCRRPAGETDDAQHDPDARPCRMSPRPDRRDPRACGRNDAHRVGGIERLGGSPGKHGPAAPRTQTIATSAWRSGAVRPGQPGTVRAAIAAASAGVAAVARLAADAHTFASMMATSAGVARRCLLPPSMHVQAPNYAHDGFILGKIRITNQWETPASSARTCGIGACARRCGERMRRRRPGCDVGALISGMAADASQTSYVRSRYATADKSKGVSRNRFPVSRNTAPAIAGVTAADSSPTPPGFAGSPCTM